MILDQTSGAGFLPLGEFNFAAGPGQAVRLQDNTGEPYADRIRIGFDAIRVVPRGAEPAEVFDPEVPVEAGEGVVAAGEVVFEPPVAVVVDQEMSGGCRCSTPPKEGGPLVVLFLVFAGLVRSRIIRR